MISVPHGSVFFVGLLWFLGFLLGFLRIILFTPVWLLQELHSWKRKIRKGEKKITNIVNCTRCKLAHTAEVHTLIFGSSFAWSLSFSSGFSSLFIFSASLRFLLSSSLHLRRSSSRRRFRSSSLLLLSSFFSSLMR